jgi:predicted AlkP superfamily phosphohydrolase/phosphomutase
VGVGIAVSRRPSGGGPEERQIVFEGDVDPGETIRVDALELALAGEAGDAIELRHEGNARSPGVLWSDVVLTLESTKPDAPAGWTVSYADAVADFEATLDWPDAEPAPHRLLVIGIDGASWPLIDELIAAGDVPNLAELTERGRRGHLASTFVPESAMAWTSLRTGVTAGHHGVYHFMSPDRVRRSYWSWLDDAGLRGIVIGVPKSSPREPWGGLLIGGWDLSADGAYTRPESLGTALARTGYRPEIANVRDTARFAVRMRERTDIALALLDRLDWDHAFVVYEYADTAGHRFGLRTDGWRAAYRQLDHELGRLLAAQPPDTTLLIVSDHGWKRFDRAFSPGAWLESNGFGHWKPHIYGGHRVALRPAQPLGPEAEASEIATLRDRLLEVRDPDSGEPVVTRVLPFTDGVPGPFSERSALRAFVELDPRYHAAGKAKGDTIWPDLRPEHHDLDGLYLLVGPDVRPGRGRGASVLDVAPSVAAFFGVEAPEDVTGTVLDGLPTRTPHSDGPAQGVRRAGAEDPVDRAAPSDALRESLRALGYIDEGEAD